MSYFLSADLIISKFPNKYWGVGNDVPSPERLYAATLSADVSFSGRSSAQRLYVGLHLEHIKMLKRTRTERRGGRRARLAG
jgi:hypothetical protein